jgi:hypothetical protein
LVASRAVKKGSEKHKHKHNNIKRVVYQNGHLRSCAPRRALPSPAARARNKKKKADTCARKSMYNPRHARHKRDMCLRATRGKQTSGSQDRQSPRNRGVMSHIQRHRLRYLPRVPTFFPLLFGARSLILSLSKTKLASSSHKVDVP